VGGHKATGLHALAVRRNAVARELGAASAARGHHTGIRRQGIGHRGGGRRRRCQDQTHIGVHRLLVRGTQAQLALEGLQLLHEVEVGRHIRLPVPHHHEGVVETQATGVHQVGERHGHRARDPGQAVDQHCRVGGPRFLCGFREKREH